MNFCSVCDVITVACHHWFIVFTIFTSLLYMWMVEKHTSTYVDTFRRNVQLHSTSPMGRCASVPTNERIYAHCLVYVKDRCFALWKTQYLVFFFWCCLSFVLDWPFSYNVDMYFYNVRFVVARVEHEYRFFLFTFLHVSVDTAGCPLKWVRFVNPLMTYIFFILLLLTPIRIQGKQRIFVAWIKRRKNRSARMGELQSDGMCEQTAAKARTN